MTDTIQKPEILAVDKEMHAVFAAAFSKLGLKAGKRGWHSVKTWSTVPSTSAAPLLVALMLDDVSLSAPSAFHSIKDRETFFLIFQGDLPARAIPDRLTYLDIRSERRVHIIESSPKDRPAYVERLLVGLDCTSDETHILDAWWEEDTFVLVSPLAKGFKKLRAPLQALPPLATVPRDQLHNFQIDDDGLFVYWPDIDVHLGWEQFHLAVDKEALIKVRQQSTAFNKAYGQAIRQLRSKHGLRQIDIKGLTPRQVGRIERGQSRATHAALTKLAAAHKLPLNDYLDDLSKRL